MSSTERASNHLDSGFSIVNRLKAALLWVLVIGACPPGWADTAVEPGEAALASAGADDVPAGADDVPAGADDVPAGADDVPAGADDVPAGADDVPAGADDVPAGADDVPAGADDVSAGAGDVPWWFTDADGDVRVRLYFFWTRTCPHCTVARPDIERMARQTPWLALDSRELTADSSNTELYQRLAERVGAQARSVPAFLFCGQLVTGYDDAAGMGAMLLRELTRCREAALAGSAPAVSAPPVALPGLGDTDLSGWSLPVVAITLGALDSFNPCAFFVLLFLLSLMVNARSRGRMAVIGGVFVAVSGIVYFAFMAAWLNLFLLVGQLTVITLVAGGLAIAMGVLNVKDYFFLRTGPSLSIPERSKPGLFQRVRRLVAAERYPALIGGTLLLAVVANAYELLCTAGFPMVFTRVLTLRELPLVDYYAYLALYCMVYVVPLLAIVAAFTVTLGRRKLTDREGRILKLMSGLVMTGLGVVLVTAPAALGRVSVTLALLGGALIATLVISRFRIEAA